MKRPQKVTREDRLSQYARKMYEKEKIGKQWEEELPEDCLLYTSDAADE